MVYDHAPQNRRNVAPYVDRLLAADGFIAIFPVWNLGFPAMLKGYFDRVFLPGVAFEIQPDGSVATTAQRPAYRRGVHLWRVQAPVRAARRRAAALHQAVGEGGLQPGAACDYLALYDLNAAKEVDRCRFVKQVSERFSGW